MSLLPRILYEAPETAATNKTGINPAACSSLPSLAKPKVTLLVSPLVSGHYQGHCLLWTLAERSCNGAEGGEPGRKAPSASVGLFVSDTHSAIPNR